MASKTLLEYYLNESINIFRTSTNTTHASFTTWRILNNGFVCSPQSLIPRFPVETLYACRDSGHTFPGIAMGYPVISIGALQLTGIDMSEDALAQGQTRLHKNHRRNIMDGPIVCAVLTAHRMCFWSEGFTGIYSFAVRFT